MKVTLEVQGHNIDDYPLSCLGERDGMEELTIRNRLSSEDPISVKKTYVFPHLKTLILQGENIHPSLILSTALSWCPCNLKGVSRNKWWAKFHWAQFFSALTHDHLFSHIGQRAHRVKCEVATRTPTRWRGADGNSRQHHDGANN